jgi:murein DD-endopeptidase MepM/ murein hydrolase activator NlpD
MKRIKFLKKEGLKKWVAISALVGSIALLPGLAAFANDNQKEIGQSDGSIPTVYHVYIGDTSIGTVDNASLVSQVVDKAIQQAQQGHPDETFTTDPKVTTVSEMTFNPTFDDKTTLAALNDEMKVVPAVVGIVIDGKPMVYVKNNAEAIQTIHNFEKQFVSEDTIKKFEVTDLSNGQIRAFADNEDSTDKKSTTDDSVQNMSFQQNITFEPVTDNGEHVLSPDEAVKQLTEGERVNATYQIHDGDTLVSIAHKFGFKLNEFLKLNPKMTDHSTLKIGDTVIVKKPKADLELKVEKNVTKKQAINYSKKVKPTNKLFKGQSKTLQKGHNGKKEVTYHVTSVNGDTVDQTVLDETTLSKPQDEIVEVGTKVMSSRGSGNLSWPTIGGTVTSPYGMRWGAFHKGIDIAGVANRTILAADNGVVTSAGWDNGGYGNRVVINHNNGLQTTYNHMSSIKVHAGQVVRKGEPVGIMGETGDATGVHLHFEVYQNGHLVNPSRFVHR